MKSSTCFLVLILAVATQSILGQSNQDPIYFINSVEVDFSKVHINPLNIDSIRVDKENFENGAIYIYTKKQCNFISIEKVVEDHVDNAIMDKTLLFRINGTLVEDINGVLIDDSFNIYVEVEDLSQVKYVEKKHSSLMIINIDLEEKERKEIIRLRG